MSSISKSGRSLPSAEDGLPCSVWDCGGGMGGPFSAMLTVDGNFAVARAISGLAHGKRVAGCAKDLNDVQVRNGIGGGL